MCYMKITHCIYNLDSGGGAENLLIDIVNSMCTQHDVELIIINNVYDQAMLDRIDKRVKVVTLNRKQGSRSIVPILRLNWELLRFGSQIVHCHNFSIPAYIFPKPGRGLYYTIHALNISMKYSGRMNKMFAISDAVRDDVLPTAKSEVVTIPNGISIKDIVTKDSFDYHFPEPFRIVNVARLEMDKKGQDILIEAVARLKNEGIVVNVDFIGEGSSHSSLEEMITRHGLNEQIRLLGLKDRDYIYSHLHEYDAMCHPSRYEGFGLTVAEGMAANLPIIVSDEGGPFELIDKGQLGQTFKMNDVSDCASKLKEMMLGYEKYASLTTAAREKVVEQYSIDAMVNKYLNNYL